MHLLTATGGAVWYEVRLHRDTGRASFLKHTPKLISGGQGCRGANIRAVRPHGGLRQARGPQEDAGKVGKG